MLFAIAVSASEKVNDFTFYHRGVFVSLDFAPGAILNSRAADRERNSSTGTDVAVGYRFCPQLAVALGTGAHGYSNRTLTCGDTVPRKVENTCVPVFVRLRSDFRDREVSPYVQMDDGEVLNFGREDYLVDNDGNSVLVRTVGSPDFKQTLEPFARFKIGFTF